jgi:hypothetical protein
MLRDEDTPLNAYDIIVAVLPHQAVPLVIRIEESAWDKPWNGLFFWDELGP